MQHINPFGSFAAQHVLGDFVAHNSYFALAALRNWGFVRIHSLSQSIFSRNLLRSSGFVKQLIVLLKNGSSAIQELAASAISNLSQTDEIKRALGEAGYVGLLAQMLDGKPSFSQPLVVRALSSLFVVDTNRKEFIKLMTMYLVWCGY